MPRMTLLIELAHGKVHAILSSSNAVRGLA